MKPEQMVSVKDGSTPDKMELLNALEMSLGSMENRRQLSSPEEQQELVELIEAVSKEYTAEWFASEFHPIDESDPML